MRNIQDDGYERGNQKNINKLNLGQTFSVAVSINVLYISVRSILIYLGTKSVSFCKDTPTILSNAKHQFG